jgi:hypothetical protein
VLQKWEDASRDTRSWSASFTRFEYDRVFRTEIPARRGRLYWDATGRGFYEIAGDFLMARDNNGVLRVDYRARTYIRTLKAESERMRELLAQSELSCWDRFWGNFGRAVVGDVTIDEILPLCTHIDAAAIQRQFECSCREDGETIFLTMLPRTEEDRRMYRQLDVQLSRETFQLLAHRRIADDERELIHVFEEARQNVMPADLDERLHPRLSGFRDIHDAVFPASAPAMP